MANDKPTTGGAGYIPSASSPEDIKKMLNFFGTYFLKGLGAVGQLMTAPLTQPDPMSMPYKSKKQLDQEKAIQTEKDRQVGTVMSYLSPLNYGVSLATGNGWDPISGEEQIALWEPYQQALARGAELYTIGKTVKGIKKGVTAAYDHFNQPKLPLIEPPANPEHFRFVDFDYSDYWTPIEYTEETIQPKYPYPKYKPIREPKAPKKFNNPQVSEHPGVQLRSLMKGSPLEAQVDKWGNIKVQVLRQYFGEPSKLGRGRSALERRIVNEVLDSYGNVNKVNFNRLKQDVFYKLLKFQETSTYPTSMFHSTKAGRVGYHNISYSDARDRYKFVLLNEFPERFTINGKLDIIDNTTGKVLEPEDFEQYKSLIPYYVNEDDVHLSTSDIPVIDMKYRKYLGQVNNIPSRSLGENTVFALSDEPDVLYVGDMNSAWATRPNKTLSPNADTNTKIAYAANKLAVGRILNGIRNARKNGTSYKHLIEQLEHLDFEYPLPMLDWQLPYLKRTFFRRQVQAALNTAAKYNKTKVRFPTEETLAKLSPPNMIADPRAKQLSQVYKRFKANADNMAQLYGEDSPQYKSAKALADRAFNDGKKAAAEKVISTGSQLKVSRFNNIPKILKQLLPENETRIVTDRYGNTWIEVDIPWNYHYTEQMFKKGGKL